MPKFRFKVVDKEGTVKVGSLSGPDLEASRAHIEGKGYRILELLPEAEGRLEFKSLDSEFRGLVFERTRDGSYSFPLSERLGRALSWSRQTEHAVLLICAALSFLWLIIEFQGLPQDHQADSETQEVSVVVEGRLHSPPEPGSSLVLKLDQIPYQKSFPVEDAVRTGQQYRLEVTLLASVKPDRGKVELKRPDGERRLSRTFLLSGEPLNGEVLTEL